MLQLPTASSVPLLANDLQYYEQPDCPLPLPRSRSWLASPLQQRERTTRAKRQVEQEPLSLQTFTLAEGHSLTRPRLPSWRAESSSGGDIFGNSPMRSGRSALGTHHKLIPLRLSPAAYFPTGLYVSAQIDCGAFISSSIPLQQGVLCCEFMAGLCSSLSHLIGQDSCDTWSPQPSRTGSRRERWALLSLSVIFCHNQPL